MDKLDSCLGPISTVMQNQSDNYFVMDRRNNEIELRGRIIGLRNEGLSIRAIASELSISTRTVAKWIRRWQQSGNLTNQVKRPRSRVTTRQLDEMIIRAAEESPLTNAVELQERLGLAVSVSTIRRRLLEARVRHSIPAKKEPLPDTQHSAMLELARQHVNQGLDFWSQVVFPSNQTTQFSGHSQVPQWNRNDTGYDRAHIYDETRNGHQEGIVLVLDVAPPVRSGTDETFFSLTKKCVTNILQRKIFAEKCRDQVGIVLFGTDRTDNKLASAGQYQNITVLRKPQLVNWELINSIENLPRGNSNGDWLDALVVAMDLFAESDGPTVFKAEDDEDMDVDQDSGANNHGKPLNWNGKPKTAIQEAGEALIARLTTEVDGIICSFEEAIPQLIFYQKRSSGSANWDTKLDIGPNFVIPINGRIKIKHVTLPTWKTVYSQDDSARIIKEVSYHLQDDAQTCIEEDDIISGYRYGTTLVPFSDDDEQMKYSSDTLRSLSVLGFTSSSNVTHTLRCGDQVLVITAREGDENAAVALSSVIQGLVELDMVAITRRIYNRNSNPVMGVMIPEITTDYECLIWIPLPFQEDVRVYSFPPLQGVINKLTDEQNSAMDDLITAMDLQEEDEEDEELDPKAVLNPQIQHYYNCHTHRALYPDTILPPPVPHVLNILNPPESVVEARDAVAARLASQFPTKKIEKNTKKSRENLFAGTDANTELKDEEGAGVSSQDLTRSTVTCVTTATPVQDFMALMKGEAPNYKHICQQMAEVVLQLIDNTVGASSAGQSSKIIDCLTTFRREAVIIDPKPYNEFALKLKENIIGQGLTPVWDVIKQDKLGLITEADTGSSHVTSEEAAAFYSVEAQEEPKTEAKEEEQELDDLLDDL
ncbi:X-ray repair cross-complementing protein 5-like isoform X2 [Oratosquilla oratoria]|uniref:X-ray repair cross-complementing protein 5-like isoform X2 n=1 Tax=Oratosquilla oratoria TaxID=337810 RepID=UPI003F76F54D